MFMLMMSYLPVLIHLLCCYFLIHSGSWNVRHVMVVLSASGWITLLLSVSV